MIGPTSMNVIRNLSQIDYYSSKRLQPIQILVYFVFNNVYHVDKAEV